MSGKLGFDDFLERAKRVHGNFYDYSKVSFVCWGERVEIVCPLHGSFYQSPLNHTTCGHGCTKCAADKVRLKKTKYDDWATTKAIIDDAVRSLGGKFPTFGDVQKHELWDANRVILKLGGYNAARKKFGIPVIKKTNGYWKNIENVRMEIKNNFPLMYESGVMPTYQMLSDAGCYICNFHGSLADLARKLGLEIATRWVSRDGHVLISQSELLLDEYLYSREIPHEPEAAVGRYRCDQKVGDYYVEIWGYPQRKNRLFDLYNKRRKKKEKFYKENKLNLVSIEGRTLQRGRIVQIEDYLDSLFSSLGFNVSKKHEFSFDVIHKNCGFRWSEKLVIEKLQEIWKKTGIFPTCGSIRKAKIRGINDVVQMFGGWAYFRQKMGVGRWVKPDRKWSEDEIISRLMDICDRLGSFPNDKDLPSDLRNAIRHCSYVDSHDLNWYRLELGYPILKKSRGYWSAETIKEEVLRLIKEQGCFPSNVLLRKLRRYDLIAAIQQMGGFKHWRQTIEETK